MDILVVDDEQDIIDMLRRNLGTEGHDVDGAINRDEAVRMMKEHNYPVVLLDIKFPDASGTEILADLKEIHPPVNVLMITGYSSLENVMESLGEGAIDYLKKPLDMDEILNRLDHIERKVERWREEIGLQS